jgi:hypothetical protein
MRRLLAATALAALCATAAACGSDGDNSPGHSAATTAGVAATTAAAPGNTKQICADIQKVSTDATAKFSQEFTKIRVAAASGDKSAEADAVKIIKTMFTEWANGLRAQADKASDGELAAALNDTADEIEKVAGSLTSADDLKQVDKLFQSPERGAAKIGSFCG